MSNEFSNLFSLATITIIMVVLTPSIYEIMIDVRDTEYILMEMEGRITNLWRESYSFFFNSYYKNYLVLNNQYVFEIPFEDYIRLEINLTVIVEYKQKVFKNGSLPASETLFYQRTLKV